jgi:multidrug efflux system membrane fusion protein
MAALLLAGCAPGGAPQMPPPEVSVAQVVSKRVTEWESFSGRVVAIETIEIRPRVSGYLDAVHFREGGEVARGAALFTVDDREYRAALDAARANTARVATRFELAQGEAARATRLEAARAISGEELAARAAELRQAEADLQAARAQERQSALNLEFTRIHSPIAGYASSAAVRPGNLVAAGTTLLTTVVSIDPIYVEFAGDERMYLNYQRNSRGGSAESRRALGTVRVGLADETDYPRTGELVFVDNALDPATGTIRARARLSNKDRRLTPGLFARVELPGGDAREALLIHERALLTDQDRKYVYVVGADNRAVRKDVRIGAQAEGLRIVLEGLAPSDRVVVNGVRKIFFPGMPVAPAVVPMDQPGLQPAPPAPSVAPPAQGPATAP